MCTCASVYVPACAACVHTCVTDRGSTGRRTLVPRLIPSKALHTESSFGVCVGLRPYAAAWQHDSHLGDKWLVSAQALASCGLLASVCSRTFEMSLCLAFGQGPSWPHRPLDAGRRAAPPRVCGPAPTPAGTGEAEPGLTRKRGVRCASSYFPPGWQDGLTAEGTWREAPSLQGPGHVTRDQRLEAGQEAPALGIDGCEGWPHFRGPGGLRKCPAPGHVQEAARAGFPHPVVCPRRYLYPQHRRTLHTHTIFTPHTTHTGFCFFKDTNLKQLWQMFHLSDGCWAFETLLCLPL